MNGLVPPEGNKELLRNFYAKWQHGLLSCYKKHFTFTLAWRGYSLQELSAEKLFWVTNIRQG